MQKQEQHRQGDIYFIRCAPPTNATKLPRKPGQRIEVALGEVTNHAHAVWEDAVIALAEPGTVEVNWITVPDAVTADVVHEEHGTITLNPGNWKVVRQREYDLGQVRRVLD